MLAVAHGEAGARAEREAPCLFLAARKFERLVGDVESENVLLFKSHRGVVHDLSPFIRQRRQHLAGFQEKNPGSTPPPQRHVA